MEARQLGQTDDDAGLMAAGDELLPQQNGAFAAGIWRPVDLACLAALLVVVLLVVRNAWMSDDAYITLRTIDNAVHGYGLRWNIAERVQSYTHPLWMGLLLFFYYGTREPFFTPIVVSVLVTAEVLLVLWRGLAAGPFSFLLAAVILGLSKCFLDFSTSGLENCLSHLLLVIFLALYYRGPRDGRTRRYLFWLSLTAALCALNRPDLILLVGPALAYEWWRGRSWAGSGAVALGMVPYALWTMFSLFYYGFPFPNTAYAKLHTGIPAGEMIAQGLLYANRFLAADPLSAFVVALAPVAVLATRDRRSVAVGAGIALSVVYVIRVGGDFMEGRFFTPAFVCAVVLVSRMEWGKIGTRSAPMAEPEDQSRRSLIEHCALPGWGWFCAVGAVVLLGFAGPNPPLTSIDATQPQQPITELSGIADERAYYAPWMALSRTNRWSNGMQHPWIKDAIHDRDDPNHRALPRFNVGIYGYYAGPTVGIVDQFALSDPLLARLPIHPDPAWRIGHFGRDLPEGYLESFAADQNLIKDPQLAEYYDHLRLITRGSLLAPGRLMTILKMNFGTYDHLLPKEAAE